MGYAQLRKIYKSETKWTDKTANKHKHDFCVHAIVRLRHLESGTDYYDVMKCKHCNSFRSMPKEGAINGFISGRDYNGELPLIKLKTSHKYIIEFKGAELDE